MSGAESWALTAQVALAEARAGERSRLAVSHDAFAAALRLRPDDAKLLADARNGGATRAVDQQRHGGRAEPEIDQREQRAMNEQDSKANTRAVDALINYETVKYFSNEHFEQSRYDDNLRRLERAAAKSQTSLSVLNVGQSLIVATAVTLAPPLTAPSNASATAPGSAQVRVSWTASTGGVGAKTYLVERCQGILCTAYRQIAAVATASFEDSGLTANTTYRYRVRAKDAVGNQSDYSNVATAVTLGLGL